MKIFLLFIITLFCFAIPVIFLAIINYDKQPRSCGGSDCDDCWCKK